MTITGNRLAHWAGCGSLLCIAMGLVFQTAVKNQGLTSPTLVFTAKQDGPSEFFTTQERQVHFEVENRSKNRSARLLGAEWSCGSQGCVMPRGLPMTILPGKTVDLEVGYLGSKLGPFVRKFSVFTDCAGQSEVVLSIAGNVKSPTSSKLNP